MSLESQIWYPCGQSITKNREIMLLSHANASLLHLKNGTTLIDAISSWWCKSLGHGHPHLKTALLEQIHRYEHAIHANTSNDILEQLADELCQLAPGNLTKVFFAGDGSSAVEVAMKMSLHSRQLMQQPQRTQFIALRNGYHGETCGALSVSESERFNKAYQSMLFEVTFLGPLPYVSGTRDPLWQDCHSYWPQLEAQLEPLKNTATALILEPLVQGSGGMLIYSQDLLRRLSQWCQRHQVHLIADEIMTGLGRTGLPFACNHSQITPDFLLLSKGLTSGWLPFSAVLIHEAIHQLFAEQEEIFWHSHTFGGNALGASVALACLKTLAEENIYQRVQTLEQKMLDHIHHIATKTQTLKNIRSLGGIVAADLISESPHQAKQICQQAIKLGALLRPLEHTLYWCPPLNIEDDTLAQLAHITLQAISDGR